VGAAHPERNTLAHSGDERHAVAIMRIPYQDTPGGMQGWGGVEGLFIPAVLSRGRGGKREGERKRGKKRRGWEGGRKCEGEKRGADDILRRLYKNKNESKRSGPDVWLQRN